MVAPASLPRQASHGFLRFVVLDVIFSDLAHEKVEHGAALARAAGFNATARVACGKTWETICVVADEVDAEPIVIGTGGPYRARPRCSAACHLLWFAREACRARWTGVVITSASTSARSQ